MKRYGLILATAALVAFSSASIARDYPRHGTVVRDLPSGYSSMRGGYYYGRGGSWYRPQGRRFVVVAPPIGFYVPFLPPFYVTRWYGGIPYYFADDAYYVWDSGHREYRVTEPPAGAEGDAPFAGGGDLFIYPRNGQSESQQASDRYECHSWAASQTGFDPTEGQSNGHRDDYHRAMTACLEARGYSVK